ncbi:hypothetical protein [Brevibacterium siliguriense]|uniref:hypothetical protein n=1 Tax=Brevibacterium siliguriense TaxID=1136497 RepID=UPI000A8C5111|nr:hypothetical protein [Brevibacterium siliguriense]
MAASLWWPHAEHGFIASDAVDHMVISTEATVASMRSTHHEVDSADSSIADIDHSCIARFEQQAWFISAETRAPR